MKLLTLVLNKVDRLEDLLKVFAEKDVTGATIINSTGMARELMNDDSSIIASFRYLLNPDRKESKTIFMVIRDDKLEMIVKIIEDIVGSLDEPDTGILFTVPIDEVRGYKH